MNNSAEVPKPHLLNAARQAFVQKNWPLLAQVSEQIISTDANAADGYYFRGITRRVQRQMPLAAQDFEHGLKLDPKRHDIALELANVYSTLRRNAEVLELLQRYTPALHDSPRYLDLAGTIYTEIGMAHQAWPLFCRATELQPGVDLFQANKATCAVFLGKIEIAKEIYQALLQRFPDHRKNHYQLSRLSKATDRQHIEQMQNLLATDTDDVRRNVPLYFAIAKELEDLEDWDNCFDYYQQGCAAVNAQLNYKVENDIEQIDTIINTCDQTWLQDGATQQSRDTDKATPIFILGLPRTGTTLVERIVSSHSQVSSLGETLFLQMAIRTANGMPGNAVLTPQQLAEILKQDLSAVADQYMQAIDYRLAEEPFFIEKLPLNFLHVGLIAKAWPQARIVHLSRDPMDTCFAMYKQVFTWAYQYSYAIDDLGKYYLAYDRLRKHWAATLGERFVEISYESLVSDQEAETRALLQRLGLEFETACLDFEKNTAPSATASSVQVRSKVHTGSVQKWRHFSSQLAPLREMLEAGGVNIG